MASPPEALGTAAAALDQGVRIGCFRPSSVPDGISRLRLTARATLAGADLDRAAAVVSAVVRKREQR